MKRKTKRQVQRAGRMYLVIARTTMDELPILLTPSITDAKQMVASVTEKQVNEAADFMKVDYAEIVNIAIATFTRGKPTALDLVRTWNDSDYTTKPEGSTK